MATYEAQLNADLQWALREGSMHFEGDSAVHKTLRRIVERLNELGVDYAIAGGMALFFHGYRRFTEDVVVLVTQDGLDKIHANLDGLGYVRPFEKSKNLRDAETGVQIDFLISGGYPGDGKPGPISFPIPAAVAYDIDGANFVALPRLIELKLASGKAEHRLKDLADVQELIRVIDLPIDFAQELDDSVAATYEKLWHAAQKAAEDEL